MSTTDAASASSSRALPIAGALITWIGVQTAGVGYFDRANFGTTVGGKLITAGIALAVIGAIFLIFLRTRGPIGAKKVWFLAIGLTPLTLFPLFIIWRIFFSFELIDDCDDGDAVACRRVAATRVKRGRVPEGIELYSKGCALDDARSCRELAGQAKKHPDAVEDDAASYYAKACDLDDAIGCNRAGQLLRNDAPERAQELFSKACEMGYVSACSESPSATDN